MFTIIIVYILGLKWWLTIELMPQEKYDWNGVATRQRKVRKKKNFFQVREMSGTFVIF